MCDSSSVNSSHSKSPEERFAQIILDLTGSASNRTVPVINVDHQDDDDDDDDDGHGQNLRDDEAQQQQQPPEEIVFPSARGAATPQDVDSLAQSSVPQALAELIQEHRQLSLSDATLLRRLEQISECLVCLQEQQSLGRRPPSSENEDTNTSSLTGDASLRRQKSSLDPPASAAAAAAASRPPPADPPIQSMSDSEWDKEFLALQLGLVQRASTLSVDPPEVRQPAAAAAPRHLDDGDLRAMFPREDPPAAAHWYPSLEQIQDADTNSHHGIAQGISPAAAPPGEGSFDNLRPGKKVFIIRHGEGVTTSSDAEERTATQAVQCLGCGARLPVPIEYELVLCPECEVISPGAGQQRQQPTLSEGEPSPDGPASIAAARAFLDRSKEETPSQMLSASNNGAAHDEDPGCDPARPGAALVTGGESELNDQKLPAREFVDQSNEKKQSETVISSQDAVGYEDPGYDPARPGATRIVGVAPVAAPIEAGFDDRKLPAKTSMDQRNEEKPSAMLPTNHDAVRDRDTGYNPTSPGAMRVPGPGSTADCATLMNRVCRRSRCHVAGAGANEANKQQPTREEEEEDDDDITYGGLSELERCLVESRRRHRRQVFAGCEMEASSHKRSSTSPAHRNFQTPASGGKFDYQFNRACSEIQQMQHENSVLAALEVMEEELEVDTNRRENYIRLRAEADEYARRAEVRAYDELPDSSALRTLLPPSFTLVDVCSLLNVPMAELQDKLRKKGASSFHPYARLKDLYTGSRHFFGVASQGLLVDFIVMGDGSEDIRQDACRGDDGVAVGVSPPLSATLVEEKEVEGDDEVAHQSELAALRATVAELQQKMEERIVRAHVIGTEEKENADADNDTDTNAAPVRNFLRRLRFRSRTRLVR